MRHHLVQNEQPRFASLLQRFFHDLGRHVRNLDVHLQAGNALLRSGYFEVHVAVMIFRARDIGQNGVIIAFHHQAHRDARDRIGHRYARIHQRQRCAAHGGHGAGTVRFQNVAHHAQRVGELVFSSGITAAMERSANAPCPISRRPGPRMNPTSPTLKGGKL